MSTRKSGSKKKNNNLYYIVGAVVAAVVVAGVLVAVSQSGGGSTGVDDDVVAEIQARTEGIPAGGLVLGDPDAPVTITEYSDIACIHCRTAALSSLPAVIDGLVRDGQAKLEFHPTPFIALGGNPSSERGALGVLAAAQQDAAWPFSEMLLHMQGSGPDWLSDDDMTDAAERLGLDADAWSAAYAAEERAGEYRAALDAARAAGVNSTPTFIITGPGGTERVEGAVASSVIVDAVQKVSTPS